MTLRDLQIFQAVADHRSMSLAAQLLQVSQPTVSHVIADIESDYGIQLFERLGKRLFITGDGELLLSYAHSILSLYAEMEHSLDQDVGIRPLRVGATMTVGSSILVNIINSFEQESTIYKSAVFIDNTQVMEDKLLANQLDVALVEGEIRNPSLLVRPVFKDELVLVCSNTHPFAKRTEIQAQDLQGEPFVLREPGSGTRKTFERYLQANDIHIVEKWVCHGSDAILQAVLGNQGMTVISLKLVEHLIDEGKLHHIQLEDSAFDRTFNLVYHKDKLITGSLQRFIELIHTWSNI